MAMVSASNVINGSADIVSDAYHTLCSFTLPVGAHLISATVSFPSNNTGFRRIGISADGKSFNMNSNMEHKLSNHGYYNAETSINDMTNPGIYRFYVNPNTDNANYLGWTARTLLICTGDCAGYMYQYFFSDWGHFVYRRNDIQGIITFDYNVLLRRFDAKNEIAELNNRIAALENLIKSNA